MNNLPKRKLVRIEDYDYSTPGAYFITVCTADRAKIFWSDRRGELYSPANIPLSDIGIIVDNEIQKLNTVYDAVRVDKYCIMPDHIHFILTINTDKDGQTQFPPTVNVVGLFVGGTCGRPSKQCCNPINQPIHHACAHTVDDYRPRNCKHLRTNAKNKPLCVCQVRTHIFVFY